MYAILSVKSPLHRQDVVPYRVEWQGLARGHSSRGSDVGVEVHREPEACWKLRTRSARI